MSAKPGTSSGAGSAPPSQEYVVRVPKEVKKKYSILKFHHGLKTDLTKAGPLKMERENNLKDYKLSYDMDMQPKFGEGSEFGREQREEARRKKYGIYRKKYNPEDQPWLMKLGDSKNVKRLKGVKEGGIANNASYFFFTQCPDGAFEAYPIDDWYHFTPQIKYKCLSSEEAEEEFIRRDKTLNFFSIMVKKRLRNEDDEELEEEADKTKKTKGKKKKDFLLTDLDEWAVMSDGDVEEGSDLDDEKAKQTKDKKGKGKVKKSKRSMKTNSDDEALEESDSFDEGNEVDYMTDSDSNDEDMYVEKGGDDESKYKEQGVEDEEGLKKLVNSDDEDEEEEEKEKEEEEEENTPENIAKKDDSDSESSASSESDSDPEKDTNFSALFMQKKSTERKKLAESEKNRSRSVTPTEDKVKKRKADADNSASSKKSKVEPKTEAATPKPEATMSPSASSSSLASEGISEESVRRYLMRKPMTTKDLVQKFKNTGLSKDQLVESIAKILKRLDPEKTKIKDKLYLSIKKPDG